MTPQEFCAHVALGAAAQWVPLGIEPPSAQAVGVAVIEYAGLRLTVVLERIKPAVPLPVPPAAPILTPLQASIVSVLNVLTPTKASVIAARIGQENTGYFRGILADLERFSVVKHVKGQGYLLM